MVSEYRAGLTALIVTVEEAEPVVGRWRERFDSAAAVGVPAHVSVLVPFLDVDRIDSAVHDELKTMIGAFPPFTVRFERCAYFPDLLYLAPEPAQPFLELTETVMARWPEVPPYGGKYPEIVPHLTVAKSEDASVLEAVEADVSAGLPVTAWISSVDLFVYDGELWKRRDEFPLLG